MFVFTKKTYLCADVNVFNLKVKLKTKIVIPRKTFFHKGKIIQISLLWSNNNPTCRNVIIVWIIFISAYFTIHVIVTILDVKWNRKKWLHKVVYYIHHIHIVRRLWSTVILFFHHEEKFTVKKKASLSSIGRCVYRRRPGDIRSRCGTANAHPGIHSFSYIHDKYSNTHLVNTNLIGQAMNSHNVLYVVHDVENKQTTGFRCYSLRASSRHPAGMHNSAIHLT